MRCALIISCILSGFSLAFPGGSHQEINLISRYYENKPIVHKSQIQRRSPMNNGQGQNPRQATIRTNIKGPASIRIYKGHEADTMPKKGGKKIKVPAGERYSKEWSHPRKIIAKVKSKGSGKHITTATGKETFAESTVPKFFGGIVEHTTNRNFHKVRPGQSKKSSGAHDGYGSTYAEGFGRGTSIVSADMEGM